LQRKDDSELFTSSIVRVYSGDGIVGVGFCVSTTRILTCAHVIEKALGQRDPPLGSEVKIDSPLVNPGDRYSTELKFWDANRDIAGLEIDHDENFIDQVSPLVVINQDTLWGHHFRAFGFPQSIDQGEWVTGEMTGVNADGWIQIEGDERPVHFVEVGFSGGPVWDENLNGIVGMIVAVEKGAGIKVAFFIPSAMLADAWPDLLGDSFNAINQRWLLDLPTQYEEREVWVSSPLENLWTQFMDQISWHDRIRDLLNRMIETAGQFSELRLLVQELKKINPEENYEILWQKLNSFNSFYRQRVARQVNRMISQRERSLNLTCNDLRKRRGSNLSEDEQLLLGLDSVRFNVHEIRQKFVASPEFERCFLVISEMGAGKSFFVHEQMDEYSPTWVVQVPADYEQPDFSSALLESICYSSGIIWPDLESVEKYLDQCDAWSKQYDIYQPGPISLIVVCDDLSRFGLLQEGFLDNLTQHIRDHTQLHHFYWLLTTPHTYFANLALYSAIGRSFWKRYGFLPGKAPMAMLENEPTAAIDKWIVLDDLVRKFETGLALMNEFAYEMDDETATNQLEELESDSYLYDLLCNPLLAWIWLDMLQDASLDVDANPQEWRFVQFIQAFWKEQSLLLIKREFNQSHPKPLKELELRRFVNWIATYLKASGDFYPKRTAMTNQIIAHSQSIGQPIEIERAEFTLDVIKQGLILRERISDSLLDEPENTIEILFDGFWGLLFANELCKECTSVPNSVNEFEKHFASIHPRMLRVTLEFYLWLVESQNNLPDIPLRYCQLILKSRVLPHAAVWTIGRKAKPQLQRILVNQIREESIPRIDGETLYALLNFLTFISDDILEIPERFKIFQSFYVAIQRFSLNSYFYYITETLFGQLQSTDELVEILPYFSDCEVMDDTLEQQDVPSDMGITSLLGEISAKTLISLEYGGAWISYENFGESLDHVLAYLKNIENEYKNNKQIPGQEKGWRRYLFREWFIYYYLGKMSRFCGVRMYDQLVESGWYGYRKNRCLHRQMEQEANIAIGKLHRWRISRMDEPRYIDFITRLAESKSSLDRQNAFHIIRHTVPTKAGRHISTVDSKFIPVLRKLFQDKALNKLKNIRPFARFFQQAFDNVKKNREEDYWNMDDE
jgi:hypothetical protein